MCYQFAEMTREPERPEVWPAEEPDCPPAFEGWSGLMSPEEWEDFGEWSSLAEAESMMDAACSGVRTQDLWAFRDPRPRRLWHKFGLEEEYMRELYERRRGDV